MKIRLPNNLSLTSFSILGISFLLFTLTLTTSNSAFAAVSLTKIGALNTSANKYPEWYYKGSSPTLVGTADANSQVTVKIGEVSVTTNADASGNWSFPTNLANGDHNISITSGSQTYSFVLHLGVDLPANLNSATAGTKETTANGGVPKTGANDILFWTLGSLSIIAIGTVGYVKSGKKA